MRLKSNFAKAFSIIFTAKGELDINPKMETMKTRTPTLTKHLFSKKFLGKGVVESMFPNIQRTVASSPFTLTSLLHLPKSLLKKQPSDSNLTRKYKMKMAEDKSPSPYSKLELFYLDKFSSRGGIRLSSGIALAKLHRKSVCTDTTMELTTKTTP